MASVDQGIASLFIRAESKVTPASPRTDAVNGGAPATTHGWYGGPTFATSLAQGTDHGSIYEFFAEPSTIPRIR